MRLAKPIFAYKGDAYVRPIGRGVVLFQGGKEDPERPFENEMGQLEDLIAEGDIYIEVRAWKRPKRGK